MDGYWSMCSLLELYKEDRQINQLAEWSVGRHSTEDWSYTSDLFHFFDDIHFFVFGEPQLNII